MARKKLTERKAKLMLKEGRVRGKKITPKQKRLFGFVAGGGKPTRLRTKTSSTRRKKR